VPLPAPDETMTAVARTGDMRLLRALLAALLAAALAVVTIVFLRGDAALAGPPAELRPVVVELFSSEGCSSCPPADAVLSRLVREQPVVGAEVIALELHVDYWNSLGWVDRFSSPAFTARQRAYADAFGERSVYTPQIVVDGAAPLVGSNDAAARLAIASAAGAAKTRMQLTRVRDRVSIVLTDLAEPAAAADVWLAVTEDGLSTAVPRGENRGATLAHGPVVRTLDRVQALAQGTHGTVVKEVEVTVEPAWRREGLRAVAFVQQRGSLRITAAGAVSLR
jgi:hypothetical protein